MSRRRGHKYNYIPQTENDARDDYTDGQFALPEQKIPWKAILLSTFLCISGTICLIMGALLTTGHIDAKYQDRQWPLFILGAIMFIPGFYHVRIAYYSFTKKPGYSFDDIPEFS